jgi:hypothetical protein
VADELDVLGSPRRFVESTTWLLIVGSLQQKTKNTKKGLIHPFLVHMVLY